MARVALFPYQNPVNPYISNLSQALRGQGVELFESPSPLTQKWVLDNRGRIEILHFNWPSYYYAAPEIEEAINGLLLFVRAISLAIESGYHIVWTVHNVISHDIRQVEVDHLGKVVLARLADALIIHSECTRDRLRQFFDRGGDRVYLIPHGHYIDSYPNSLSRGQARARLGLGDDDFVYLFFGYVRPYKGLAGLIEAFKGQQGKHLRLVIAGHPHPPGYVAELVGHVGSDPRIRLDTRLIPVPDVQVYFQAADVVVLPFANILTSGSAILALSFGKPLIAPRMGGIPELVSKEMGLLYDPLNQAALAQALAHARDGFDLESAGRAAYAKALTLDWESIGRQMIGVYNRVLEGAR